MCIVLYVRKDASAISMKEWSRSLFSDVQTEGGLEKEKSGKSYFKPFSSELSVYLHGKTDLNRSY
jgi:hypothetical protein